MRELQLAGALLDADDQPRLFDCKHISIRALPRINKVRLQISPHGQWDHAALEHAVGCKLPDRPDTLSQDGPSVFWVSPYEWLLVFGNLSATVLLPQIKDVLDKATFALNDLTDRYAIIELKGQGVRELLMSACGIDLDIRSFQPQQYRLTRLASLAVILSCHQSDHFRIMVDRSEAHYLWEWLEASCQSIHYG